MKISENIRLLREKRGFSQDFIAAKLNLTQQAYSLIEKYPERTSLKNLTSIAEILKVELSSLLLINDKYIQQNFIQQNCNIASKQDVYENEKIIQNLEEEVRFLRELISKSNQ